MTLPSAAELLGDVGVGELAGAALPGSAAESVTSDSTTQNSAGITDEVLLARFLRGDREALGVLAERYEPMLLGLACGLTGRRELALEAVQDTWLRVIKYGRSFRSGSTVKTWLYRILINSCKDVRAKGSRFRFAQSAVAGRSGGEPPVAPERADSLESRSASPDLAKVRRAVDQLSGEQKLLVLLCYHNGLTHPQAAAVLDIPVGTLKSRLNTVLNTLRGAWRDSTAAEQEDTK